MQLYGVAEVVEGVGTDLDVAVEISSNVRDEGSRERVRDVGYVLNVADDS